MKYVSIDIETLGLNINAPIIEVACVFVDNKQIVAENQTYVTHARYDNCEPFAMAMHPVILRRIAIKEDGYTYTPIEHLPAVISTWCYDAGFLGNGDQKVVWAGKNASGFDIPMIDHQTKGVFKLAVPQHHRVLDPGPMFVKRGDTVTPSLSDIITAEELDVEVTHTALDDARAVVAAVECAFDKIKYSPEIKI